MAEVRDYKSPNRCFWQNQFPRNDWNRFLWNASAQYKPFLLRTKCWIFFWWAICLARKTKTNKKRDNRVNIQWNDIWNSTWTNSIISCSLKQKIIFLFFFSLFLFPFFFFFFFWCGGTPFIFHWRIAEDSKSYFA